MNYIERLKEIAEELEGTSVEPIEEDEVKKIRAKFPEIPENYLKVLTEVGAGHFGEMRFSVYGGPIEALDIFDPITATELEQYLFVGDDFSGWMVGFDTNESPWRLREFDHQKIFATLSDAPTSFAEFLCKELSRE